MFVLKKVIGSVFMPVTVCVEILLVGLFLLWFTKKQKAGKIVVSVGIALFIGFGYGGIPNTLIEPLENRYVPFQSANAGDDIKWVVVLGGGHTVDPRLPANSQLGEATLSRLIEGIRIHRLLPGSKLILSGGAPFGTVSNAEVMGDTALALGIDPGDIVLESISKDTRDEAVLVQGIIREDRFVLVTSAAHMPRSMALFRKLGMEPAAGPADFLVKEEVEWRFSPGMFFPGAGGFVAAESAAHEYMGLVWAWVRGQI